MILVVPRKSIDGRFVVRFWIEKRLRTSAGASDEAQVAEFGHLVLHDGRVVAQFAAIVFVVAGADGDDGAVGDLAQRHDTEGDRQRFIGAPVRRQRRAQKVRRTRLDQLALVVHRHGARHVERRPVVRRRPFRHQHFGRHGFVAHHVLIDGALMRMARSGSG